APRPHPQAWRRSRRRYVAVVVVAGVVIVVLFVTHLALGPVGITPWNVLRAIAGRPSAAYQGVIIDAVRMPRSLLAPVAGAMLGLSGALIQSLTRNPLTDPGLTGVTSGSVFALVLCLTFVPASVNDPALLPFAALVGGLAAVAVLYLLTRGLRDGPFAFVLKGVILGGVLASASALVLVRDNGTLPTVLLWMTGSLDAKTWADWATLWPWALAAIPAGLACARTGNVLALGEETAIGLGFSVTRARLALFGVAAVAAAAATAVVGAVGFVGLVGPHIARRLVGSDDRRVYPLAALIGAGLVLSADTATQAAALAGPGVAGAVPVGAVTALIGAPYFFYLLTRAER
ncbi:MAG TPA: iron ABC transporter permease, partial [Microbacteriaceae bacterium]|nr:iron ABC transporter permease [Microbacteriaceae bacterium]